MKGILEKLMECVLVILPFFRKKDAKRLKEFSDLVMGQYEFLVDQLEKVLKDYFELSTKVKEMHTELFALKERLAQAMAQRCCSKECKDRQP